MKYRTLGEYGFIVEFKDVHEANASFVVYQVVSTCMDGETDNTEFYLNGNIKWDSCSNFNFGDDDVMMHFCGVEAFEKHIRLLEFLYKKSFELMGRSCEEGEEWTLIVSNGKYDL